MGRKSRKEVYKKKSKRSYHYSKEYNANSGDHMGSNKDSMDQIHHNANKDELIEEKNQYIVICDLEGFESEDITIYAKYNILKITAKIKNRERLRTSDGSNYEKYDQNRKYSRNLEFPSYIDIDFIDSVFNGGQLKLVIPKTEEKIKGRKKITIF